MIRLNKGKNANVKGKASNFDLKWNSLFQHLITVNSFEISLLSNDTKEEKKTDDINQINMYSIQKRILKFKMVKINFWC